MKPGHGRKLLQNGDALQSTLSPEFMNSPDPLLQQPINNSTSTTGLKRPFTLTSPFDSSMALTILVLLTALFFMGFFSIYIRRFAEDDGGASDHIRRRRHQHHNSPLPTSRPHCGKGVDPSTVRSLPVIPYGGYAKHPIDCAICLSEFEENETVKMIPYCRHVFHPVCIDTWLYSHASCPLCRSSQMCPVAEVRLGVVQDNVDHGVNEMGRRSTVEENDSWNVVGTVGVRRTSSDSSCSSLGDRVSLQRSTSF